MKLKIPVAELKKAISIAKKALPKIILQEERGHVLCKLIEDKIVLSATNNDIKAKVIVDALEFSDPDIAFTIDPKVVEKILSKVDIDETLIEYNEEEKTIQIYTTENQQSFTTLQSFPPEKMLTFETVDPDSKNVYTINRNIILSALTFAYNYLAPLKENKKQYDFVVINNGIVYGANGINKMGFFVSQPFKSFENFKIRKESVPFLISVLKSLKDEEINLIESNKDIGIESLDGSIYFSCLKSGLEASKINTDLLKGDAPYTIVNRTKLLKTLDRLVASTSSTTGAGVEYTLSGENENGSIFFNLISNLKIVEQMDCVRINDEESAQIKHVLDFKLFKGILGSFGDKDTRLYINEKNKFFKVTSTGEVDNNKYMSAGVGSYSKVVNNG